MIILRDYPDAGVLLTGDFNSLQTSHFNKYLNLFHSQLQNLLRKVISLIKYLLTAANFTHQLLFYPVLENQTTIVFLLNLNVTIFLIFIV